MSHVVAAACAAFLLAAPQSAAAAPPPSTLFPGFVIPANRPTDAPDPAVLQVGGVSYLFSTNTKCGDTFCNVPVYRSTDQVNWQFVGDALPPAALPAWAHGVLYNVWAPMVVRTGDRYLLYVTPVDTRSPRPAGGLRHVIAVASAPTPQGPYADLRIVQAQGSAAEPGEGAIDPSVVSYGGARYLLWKSDVWPGNSLYARRLAVDGRALDPAAPEVKLLTATDNWENNIIEGPAMAQVSGEHFLLYSGNDYFNRQAGVGYAACPAGPTGPCIRRSTDAPLIGTRSGLGTAPGGAEYVRTPEASPVSLLGLTRIVFHAFPYAACQGDGSGNVPSACMDRRGLQTGTLARPSPGTLVASWDRIAPQTVACTTTLSGARQALVVDSGGMTCLQGAQVTGSVRLQPGAQLFISHSTIDGPIVAEAPSAFGLCDATVTGTITVRHATGSVLVGDAAGEACGGSTVGGAVELSDTHGSIEVAANHIGGGLQVTGTTGTTGSGPFPADTQVKIEQNIIAGALACSRNVPAPTNEGQPNRVTGARRGQCASL